MIFINTIWYKILLTKKKIFFLMRLLITGGLGFIGSNFILKILNEWKHDFSVD